jgi:hypothetical protein
MLLGMTTHPYRPTIHTQADLETVWRHLMEPLGFSGCSIWMMHVDSEGRPIPQLMEITEIDEFPDRADEHDGFARLLRELDAEDPGGSFAFLISRPGRGLRTDDRARASYLYDVGRAADVRLEVVHLATDADVSPLPLDASGLAQTQLDRPA